MKKTSKAYLTLIMAFIMIISSIAPAFAVENAALDAAVMGTAESSGWLHRRRVGSYRFGTFGL